MQNGACTLICLEHNEFYDFDAPVPVCKQCPISLSASDLTQAHDNLHTGSFKCIIFES
jgi:uncharacterized Zn-finger protein